MSPIDDGFRERIQRFYKTWQDAEAQALTRGQEQEKGYISKNIDVNESAGFIVTAAAGTFGQAKITQDETHYFNSGKQLDRYLETLSTDIEKKP